MIFPPPRGHARPIVQLYPPRSYEAEAVDYVLRVRAAGSDVSAANARAVNTLIRGLKVGGLWPALKACCLLAGPDTLAGALVPLAAGMPTPTNFNFVGGDYSRTAGLIGNATSKRINSGRSNSADPQNNQHLAAYATTGDAVGVLMGVVSASSGVSALFGDGRIRSRSATLSPSASSPASAGFFAASRASSVGYDYRTPAGSGFASVSSTPPVVTSISIFARQGDSAFVDAFCAARLAFYSIGEAIDLAALDALVAAYVAALV